MEIESPSRVKRVKTKIEIPVDLQKIICLAIMDNIKCTGRIGNPRISL